MITAGLRSNGERTRREINFDGFPYAKSEWMESGEDPTLSPTIVLIEQPANSTLFAHFHRQNQFQIFVGGGGKIGGHDVEPLTVHYAGAYTGYGPLVAGPEGLKYFTIRAVLEVGAVPITEAKTQMLPGPRRGVTAAPICPASTDVLRALNTPTKEFIIPPAADGLGVERIQLPAGVELTPRSIENAYGDFLFMIDGSLESPVGQLGQWDSLFISIDEAFPVLTAGDGGADVLILRMPRRNEKFESPHK